MSFGWSFGDILAGIKVLWDVYEAVSDGPLNAQLEASQFFDEFSQIMQCLDRWERKAESDQDQTLTNLHQQLRDQCEKFVERHMLLIQNANPRSVATREGRSTWLRKVDFSREQVLTLYQRVQWPSERKEVSRLRKKLIMFLQISTHSAVIETNEKLKDIWVLQQANSKLVESHLDVVSSIASNLKMIANPHESGVIDYPMLRRFEHAILPPEPIRAIESGSSRLPLTFRSQQQQLIENDRSDCLATVTSSRQERGLLGQDENMLMERLNNVSKRGMNGAGAELIPTRVPVQRRYSAVQPVLERLREIRTGFGDAVGLALEDIAEERQSSELPGAQEALREELELWDRLEERIQYDMKRREQLFNRGSSTQSTPFSVPATIVSPFVTSSPVTQSDPIPIPSPRFSPSLSPMTSPLLGASPSDDWLGSPERNQNFHMRTSSTSSASSYIPLVHSLPVIIQHHHLGFQGSIQSLSREDGEVVSIIILSQDGVTELRHSIDRSASSAVETSMKPFLDNSHVDKKHKFRVQFQGSHTLKIMKRDSQGLHKLGEKRGLPNPIYKLQNQKDFLEFQSLLLGKEVSLCTDVELIKTTKEALCRICTIRILVDPIYRTRSILYFRSKTKENLIPGFVEWPTTVFKDPKEPSAKCRTLALDSSDGKSLSLSKASLSRRSTQGSVTTIASFESTTAAHARLQERSGGKSIKGLVIEFYDANDCRNFWKEFVKKEDVFTNGTFPHVPH